jgi:hypothetical protein
MTNEQKTEAPEQSDMVDVLIRALEGADRVVVETPNALGEMDAHYLHAPELLTAWNTRTDLAQAAIGAAVRSTLENVIDHIFDHGNGDVNTYEGEPTWLVGDEILQAVIEPEAQQALDKLLAEKDAEIKAAQDVANHNAEVAKEVADANEALRAKLLGRDAEIARLRNEKRNLALCARYYLNNAASTIDLETLIDAAVEVGR